MTRAARNSCRVCEQWLAARLGRRFVVLVALWRAPQAHGAGRPHGGALSAERHCRQFHDGRRHLPQASAGDAGLAASGFALVRVLGIGVGSIASSERFQPRRSRSLIAIEATPDSALAPLDRPAWFATASARRSCWPYHRLFPANHRHRRAWPVPLAPKGRLDVACAGRQSFATVPSRRAALGAAAHLRRHHVSPSCWRCSARSGNSWAPRRTRHPDPLCQRQSRHRAGFFDPARAGGNRPRAALDHRRDPAAPALLGCIARRGLYRHRCMTVAWKLPRLRRGSRAVSHGRTVQSETVKSKGQ